MSHWPSPPSRRTTSSSSSAGCGSSMPGGSACRTASRCRRRWSRCSRSTSRAASGHRPRARSRCAAGPTSRTRPTVLASILVEAALSAISGVIVFVDQPRLGRRHSRAPLGAGHVRGAARLAAPPAHLPAAQPPGAEAVRGARPRAPAVRDHARAAALLLRHLGDRRLRGLVHAAQSRRLAESRDGAVPRRRLRGRGDRRRAGLLRPVGPRRTRSVDVRPAARRHVAPAPRSVSR